MSSSLSMRKIGEQMDPVHPITRLRGTAETPTVSWYKGKNNHKLRRALQTHGGQVGLYHQKEKGLSQVHRERFTDYPTISLRRFVDRHQVAKTIRMLVYNTWLINPPLGINSPPDRTQRSRNLARHLKTSDYDIIALCEVFSDEDIKKFRRYLPMNSRIGPSKGGVNKNSGLITFAGLSGFGNVKREVFRQDGNLTDKEDWASKGILYTEIDVGLSGGIDLFSTHLHAENESIRKHQILQLANFVEWHQKRENVTIVVGDFNVDGRTNDYEWLIRKFNSAFNSRYIHPGGNLRRFDDQTVDLNLEDIWLARGGPSGSTHKISNMEVVCKLDNPSKQGAPYFCNDEFAYASDHTPTDDIPGYRLDYVFVEKPNPEHLINVDISRVRRNPFWRTPGEPDLADPKKFDSISYLSKTTGIREEILSNNPSIRKKPHFLSDHIGLDLTLYVSPV